MNTKVLCAVFRRNFVSYFANPTGYVFITVFVWLCVFAAFWPNEFFNANLANLDQLNKYFPLVMLVFIPAIAMSIWAEERRQGTDELLLTIPAGDFVIVLGKYLAAVAIYTVSLLFSLLCAYTVLRILGRPDGGLFLATYFGYWLVGLAMLAIAMVASFLTANLTVAFILGALLNVPLVLAVWADSVFTPEIGRALKQWSIAEQFRDFGRGILSFSGLIYFGMIVAIMLYLSMVLIARRHWVRDKEWYLQAAHYAVRCLALVVAALGLNVLFFHHDVRWDVTSERLSTLAPETIDLLENHLNPPQPVHIEAFISPTVPEKYVQTRLNLISVLRELEARGRGQVVLHLNHTERFSDEAARAEKFFNITAREVEAQTRGSYREEPIFLGVAFTCGLQPVVLPFIDRGVPIEYELVRSLMGVTQQKRKRVGILQTAAAVMGGPDFSMGFGRPPRPEWPIVKELKKAYDVVSVDPSKLITKEDDYVKAAFDFEATDQEKMIEKGMELLGIKSERRKSLSKEEIAKCEAAVRDAAKSKARCDVLLAVQPSSLSQEQFDRFVAALKFGQPTAIFEDPMPMIRSIPGTGQGGRGMGMPPMGGGADIHELCRLLGIYFSGMAAERRGAGLFGEQLEVVYQEYNPLPRFDLPPEYVFVDHAVAKQPFNEDHAVTSNLQHLLFLYPGWIGLPHSSPYECDVLVRTGENPATVRADDSELFRTILTPFGFRELPNERRRVTPRPGAFVLAAHIHGKQPEAGTPAKTDPASLNVILVADVDVMGPLFFNLREMTGQDDEIRYDFDNVTFVLNVLDYLADDQRFIEIRKRRPAHRTLERITRATESARKQARDTELQIREEFKQVVDEERRNSTKWIEEQVQEMRKKGRTERDITSWREDQEAAEQKRIRDLEEESQRKQDQRLERIARDLNREIRGIQDRYKFWAVVLPPIPPLAVGVVVLIARRVQERQGVSRTRLR